MERKTMIGKASKRHRLHRAVRSARRAARRMVDLRLKNYALESHPELAFESASIREGDTNRA